MSEGSINDYVTPQQFQQAFPNVFPSLDSLRWHLRHRETNGWAQGGVVIEVKANPASGRGKLLMSPDRYRAYTCRALGLGEVV